MGSRRAASIVCVIASLSCCTSDRVATQSSGAGNQHARTPAIDARYASAAESVKPFSLERYEDCNAYLVDVRKNAARLVTAYGLPGAYGDVSFAPVEASGTVSQSNSNVVAEASPAGWGGAQTIPAASVGQDYSATNVQERSVDEPDLIKTDGDIIYVLEGGALTMVRAATNEVLSRLPLREQYDAEMLVEDGRVLVVSRSWRSDLPRPGSGNDGTTLTLIDASDPAAPREVSTIATEGRYLAARLIGGIVRLVTVSGLAPIQFVRPRSDRAAETKRARSFNRRLVRRTTLDDWLPNVTIRTKARTRSHRVESCGAIYRPRQFSGLSTVNVMTFDPAYPGDEHSTSVLADGEDVYATEKSLYVATTRWMDPSTGGRASTTTTQIHRFDITDPSRAVYAASGVVRGALLNRWSMSELGETLRVATTTGDTRDLVHPSQSGLTILQQQGAALVPIGRVTGLGKRERIYAVRYFGERAYVVTFRQTDPLYVLDLTDPSDPRLTGELKIPGFSSYLHPIGATHLLGVGQDADVRGMSRGLSVSLFDVSDPAAPKRVGKYVLPGSWSSAQDDPRAFLYWEATRTVVLPAVGCCEPESFTGVVVLDVSEKGAVEERGRIAHADPVQKMSSQIARSVVIGDNLFTLSSAGLMRNDLSTLSRGSWIGWPPTFVRSDRLAGGNRGNRDGWGYMARFDTPGQMAEADGGFYLIDAANRRLVFHGPDGRFDTVGAPFPSPLTGVVPLGRGSAIVATACAVFRVDDAQGEGTRKLLAGAPDAESGCRESGERPKDGSGVGARFAALAQLAREGAHSILAVDRGAHAIRRVTLEPNGATVVTVAGTLGRAGHRDGSHSLFDSPAGIARMGRNFLIADTHNDVIRVLGRDGRVSTFAGVVGSPGSGASRLAEPISVAYDPGRRLVYVGEARGPHGTGRRIRMIWQHRVVTIVGNGRAGVGFGDLADTGLTTPAGLLLTGGGMLVSDAANHRILELMRTDWGT